MVGPSLFKPVRDVGEHARTYVRAHGIANEPLFVGKQCRNVYEIDGIGRRHGRGRQRLRTRASLSKSASVERSN